MRKILAAVFAFLSPLMFLAGNAMAADTIDMSRYPSETLEQAFQADNITFDFSASNYDDTNTTGKTILYVFRKDGCSYCKNFLQFIADELLPNYASKFVVKSFEVKNNPINMGLVSKLAEFYGQASANGSYGTPIVVAGSTFSTGKVETARQVEIKSIVAGGDTYDAITEINQGVTSFKSGTLTTFNNNNVSLVSNSGLNNNFYLQASPVNKSTVALNGYEYINAYDISLYNYNTVVPISGGQYKITLPVSKAYETYRVAYIDGNNQIAEEFDVTSAQNNTITFTTTHLSNYAVYGRNGSGVVASNNVKNPKTADPVVIYSLIFAGSLVAFLGGAICYRKLAKK